MPDDAVFQQYAGYYEEGANAVGGEFGQKPNTLKLEIVIERRHQVQKNGNENDIGLFFSGAAFFKSHENKFAQGINNYIGVEIAHNKQNQFKAAGKQDHKKHDDDDTGKKPVTKSGLDIPEQIEKRLDGEGEKQQGKGDKFQADQLAGCQ